MSSLPHRQLEVTANFRMDGGRGCRKREGFRGASHVRSNGQNGSCMFEW